MVDPLSEVIALLRPQAVFSKVIGGAGRWAVRYSDYGHPSFCAVLEGGCVLALRGEKPVTLQGGDFVLLPATPSFTLSSMQPGTPVQFDPHREAASQASEIRHGTKGGKPDVRMLGGYFAFGSPDAALLVSLLPAVIHMRGVERMASLVRLVREESMQRLAGRELVLARLVEVLLVEALRAAPGDTAPPGLLRGLADKRLAVAMRHMHANPSKPWTVESLAGKSAMSRSAFFDRFNRQVGVPPMEYLLAWRMALAKDMLRRDNVPIAEVAGRVGYASASTFTTAFTRHAGQPPGRYARG